jgi:hypothetical protein
MVPQKRYQLAFVADDNEAHAPVFGKDTPHRWHDDRGSMVAAMGINRDGCWQPLLFLGCHHLATPKVAVRAHMVAQVRLSRRWFHR